MKDDDRDKYSAKMTWVTTEEQLAQIAAASAKQLTSMNSWMRAAALEKLKREEA